MRTAPWMLVALTGCSLAIDADGTQCATDVDCAPFDGAATCQRGACVPRALEPPGCSPDVAVDFASRCTTALAIPFDNCARLGLCDDDSTAVAFDKANVRDGHYPIWGAIHLLAATSNGVPSEAARALITRLSVPRLDRETVSAIIEAGFVPSCAMRVNHASELGQLTKFQPDFGCGCFYDHEVNGRTSCTACGGPGDCPASAPACNYGYCEAQ